ncbi:MAG: DNA-directed RNA polymerase subunit alpha [Candidatus Caenarcaniphilales bacterium]|jgi:DNA-directed RNA polymerase subunit alpha|nr:DNA-directed RNA polymerase subunit alpha [Candidatus Caenarcaniphilales bacterium]
MSNIELKIGVEEFKEADGTLRGRVTMQPLYRGFGHTIGNTLRRILLGRIKGFAVTHVRIEGVNHEFTAINDVSEDVLQIILNLKMLVVKMHSDESRTLTLRATNTGVVTAAQIECPNDVEIINKDLEIANLSPGAKLNMEIIVDKGFGYMSGEEHGREVAVDVIPVDSVFMPIKNVSYSVEPISMTGETSKYDKLTLDLWSDGSVSISEAVGNAAAQLIELMNPLVSYTGQKVGVIKTVDESTVKAEDAKDSSTNVSVEELELSVRSYNCLKRANINSLNDLLSLSDIDLMNIKNFGKKSAEEVLDKLESMGYSLKGNRKAGDMARM